MATGTPVTTQYNKADIAAAIVKSYGVLIQTANSLGIGKTALYDYINKYPDLWDLVHEQRKEGSQKAKAWACDIAFQTMQKLAAKSDEYPSTSFRAAAYVLDNMDEYLGCKKKSSVSDPIAFNGEFEKILNQLQKNRNELHENDDD